MENHVDKTTFCGELSIDDEGYLSTKQKLKDVKLAANVIYVYLFQRISNLDFKDMTNPEQDQWHVM